LTGNGTGHPSTRAVNSGSGNRALLSHHSRAVSVTSVEELRLIRQKGSQQTDNRA